MTSHPSKFIFRKNSLFRFPTSNIQTTNTNKKKSCSLLGHLPEILQYMIYATEAKQLKIIFIHDICMFAFKILIAR